MTHDINVWNFLMFYCHRATHFWCSGSFYYSE